MNLGLCLGLWAGLGVGVGLRLVRLGLLWLGVSGVKVGTVSVPDRRSIAVSSRAISSSSATFGFSFGFGFGFGFGRGLWTFA